MSSNAYYLAQFAIIVAVVMVAASASGCEAAGDFFQTGIILGVLGVMMILGSIAWLLRRARN